MSGGKYASETSVSVDKSRTEIERTLTRFGATAFAYGWVSDPPGAQVMFELDGRRMRMSVPMPKPGDRQFTHTPTGLERSEAGMRNEYDKELRRLWRALLLIIKAKLEAIASGIVTAEDEFMPHVVLPSGETVGEWVGPQLARLYGTQAMPALLPGLGDGEDS